MSDEKEQSTAPVLEVLEEDDEFEVRSGAGPPTTAWTRNALCHSSRPKILDKGPTKPFDTYHKAFSLLRGGWPGRFMDVVT